MAITTNIPGSGEFVQVREWSCEIHEHPDYHECDCDHCEVPYLPPCCATAEWVDAFNEDGSPKMRERGAFEAMLASMTGPLLDAMMSPPTFAEKVAWSEHSA